MLTLQIPTLLALLATALMAVVIFAPERVFPERAAATPRISFAPPLAPVPLERWEPPPEPYAGVLAPPVRAETLQPPGWPALVDPRAAGCDAATRLALVEALTAIRGEWAEAILRAAAAEEPDPGVRAAVLDRCDREVWPGTG
jgi:hypothetical protein